MSSTSLCETFRSLAFRTFDQMSMARSVGHQPLEETFTDTNLLQLKVRHPKDIHCRLFTKQQEGVNGADWEWWITDATGSSWLGLRVQAKVLNLEADAFLHLHYKSAKSRSYQLSKLKRECSKDGLIPLYCLYTHEHPVPGAKVGHCGSFAHSPESFGCALLSAGEVEALQKAGETKDRVSVLNKAIPWHCLVCCSGYGGDHLPERAWALLQKRLNVNVVRKRGRKTAHPTEQVQVGPRSAPPEYVRAILENRPSDTSPSNARGVLIITGRNRDARD